MAQVKEGGVLNTHPQLKVKGVGFDRTLGGLEMDMRLRDHLAKLFEVCDQTMCGALHEILVLFSCVILLLFYFHWSPTSNRIMAPE